MKETVTLSEGLLFFPLEMFFRKGLEFSNEIVQGYRTTIFTMYDYI